MEKKIGKISNIRLGYGGYQDAQFGLTVELYSSKECWGVTDFKGFWSIGTKCDKNCRWTENDREKSFAGVMILVNKLLEETNKESLDQLKGIPVEVTFDGITLKSWRILTEAL